ncbi:MAG: hypothetical protein COX02_01485 [Candidatus Vogelbacteria bacterium CG22_combo_CG10-13_8_21_14_all_37_9]|uniref:Uncharacterized protein n=1 Tax=Candidatus Vogelbacteria bacterium CG22_combo_CG10-13_8_21_14_all_37_9 TaxID=1975046 RepID=A0A2H0BKM4_9BACT|nr:MAG: hypothetical protein BK005_00130 [bacterium CG10_37_50]PIP58222.1 MAG: hypothetical protein COX02_01485 [Candidatus Vogelbacteria bacterium CG22_combo_CG10-13_8_21_14_all_37_9]
MFKIIKQLFLIFILALILNLIWEHWHSQFYQHYQGGEISNFILGRAALFDASFITLVSLSFLVFQRLQKRLWLAFVIGVVFALALELFALQTGRWSYNSLMPIIPLLKVGLTPTLQLGLINYLLLKLTLFPNLLFNFKN